MPKIRKCEVCRRDFEAANTGRPPKYCCVDCKKQARTVKPELLADSDFVQAETWPGDPA